MNRSTSLALQFVLLALPMATLALYLPNVWKFAFVSHTGHHNISPIQQDIDFIKSKTNADEAIGIVALNEGTLYAETRTRAALAGPGVAEMIRKVDLSTLQNEIAKRGPEKLFVGNGLEISYGLLGTDIPINFARLKRHYALAAWGPGERLMYLHRKPFVGTDLFQIKQPPSTWHGARPVFTGVWSGKTGGMWGRPLPIRYGLGNLRLGPSFAIRLLLRPNVASGSNTYLFSQFWKSPNGFILERDPLTPDGYNVRWGNGKALQNTKDFHLTTGQQSELLVSYDHGQLRVAVNGCVQIDESINGLVLDDVPVVVGGWYGPGSLFDGEIREIEIFDHAVALR